MVYIFLECIMQKGMKEDIFRIKRRGNIDRMRRNASCSVFLYKSRMKYGSPMKSLILSTKF